MRGVEGLKIAQWTIKHAILSKIIAMFCIQATMGVACLKRAGFVSEHLSSPDDVIIFSLKIFSIGMDEFACKS